MIVADEETQLTADLVTIRGEKHRLTFMTTDFANQQKFKNALTSAPLLLATPALMVIWNCSKHISPT